MLSLIRLPIALPLDVEFSKASRGFLSMLLLRSFSNASRSCLTTSTDNPVSLEKVSILSIIELMVFVDTRSRSSKMATQSLFCLKSSNLTCAFLLSLVFIKPSSALFLVSGDRSFISLRRPSWYSYSVSISLSCCSSVLFFSIMSAIMLIVSIFIFFSSSWYWLKSTLNLELFFPYAESNCPWLMPRTSSKE